jgi:hypothetical protein
MFYDPKRDAELNAKIATYPLFIEVDGREYSRTGKCGTHIQTGQFSVEYGCKWRDQRLGMLEGRAWLREDGSIYCD